MQISPPIPFVDATQNNLKHPNDLKTGTEFVRLQMYTGENDPVPTWPWPTQTWAATLHGSIPSYGGVTVSGNDWLWLGGYLVILGQTANGYTGQLTGGNVLAWPALSVPSSIAGTDYPDGIHMLTNTVSPNAWDVYYTITTYVYPNGFSNAAVNLLNTYYTGAGSEALPGPTTLRYGVQTGPSAVLFDDAGIGLVSLTGDWNQPFDFTRRIENFISISWPINVNGWVYFVDEGGKLFRTDGGYAIEVGGGYFPGVQKSEAPFNLGAIPEEASHLASWSMGGTVLKMNFDGNLHRLYMQLAAGLGMVAINSGTFQYLPSGGGAVIETGGIKLGDPDKRTHVAYVDVDVEVQGTPTTYSAVPGAAITLTATGNDLQTFTKYGGASQVVPMANVNTGTGVITTSTEHGWVAGDMVIYNSNGGPTLGPLLSHQAYYVIYVSTTEFSLSLSATITSGTTVTVAATNSFDGTLVDGPASPVLVSGKSVVRCWVNQLVNRIPRFRITLNSPPTAVKCRVWGFDRIGFNQGGLLP